MSGVRHPVLAGSWYPGQAAALAAEVDRYLEDADPLQRPAGRALIAVAPHAGYVYSGPSAGRVYGLLRGPAPRRVVILAPNHRRPLRRIALDDADSYLTPLGSVPVDRDATAALASQDAFVVDPGAHASEHAVEIQLPFLQRLWPDGGFAIVPALVPSLEAGAREEAARALDAVVDVDTLVIVSSDFTHYGRSYGYVPFERDIPEKLEQLDAGAILKILAGDAAGLVAYGAETGITMCGLPAAAVALGAGLPAGYEAALIDYRRSADRDGDFSLSVSYASLLICSGPGAAGNGA